MQQYLRWGQPDVLGLLWLLPLLVALYVHAATARRRAMERFATAAALRNIGSDRVRRRRRIRAVLMTAAIALLIVAAARPQFGAHLERVKRRGVDVLFAIDTSQSMLARDVSPDRLRGAKDAVRALIGRMEGDRVGIVAFAGDAFLYCPLTIDYGAAEMFLDALDTRVIGTQGTAIADAIEVGLAGFEGAEHSFRHLVLLTDGEDHQGGAVAAARRAAEAGVKVHVIGLGSREGEPIPILDPDGNVTGHKRDAEGEIVVSKLGEETLREIARAGGGEYVAASGSGVPVERIYAALRADEGRIVGTYQFTEYEERFQIPLGVAIVLLAIHAILPDTRRRR